MERTVRTTQPEQDCRDRGARAGLPQHTGLQQDSHGRIKRIGQAGQDRSGRTG
jgi:hypothetical protein